MPSQRPDPRQADLFVRGLLGRLFGKGSVAAVLLAGFLISGTAWAAQEVSVFGAGLKSCGQWTKYVPEDGPRYWQMTQWLSGYLSAYSLWVEDGSGPVTETDIHGAVAWVDNYCQENPLKNVATAAKWLIFTINWPAKAK